MWCPALAKLDACIAAYTDMHALVAMLDLFPSAAVFHLGLYREKVSLQPVEYYQKLPSRPTVDVLYVLDPLVATGGTAVAAVTMLVSLEPPLVWFSRNSS